MRPVTIDQKKRLLGATVGILIGITLLWAIITDILGAANKPQYPTFPLNSKTKEKSVLLTPTATPTITPTPTPTPIPVGMPLKIEIPKLKIKTNVVSVGITANNAMDVPKKTSDIGWFEGSIRPGQVGAAILVGHYDTPSGKPAIFYNLKNLAEGDEIVILTSFGEKFVFKVDKALSQTYKTFPKDLIYGKFTGRELRLITCDGVWNKSERTYSRRLVVFAKLWTEEKLPPSDKL